ncbi:MAG: patatin-like phospholipase family protein [Gemmatimonadota bacterium]|nr:patatin-like phospholipase family protein [Gemmatimonadota bacterium]
MTVETGDPGPAPPATRPWPEPVWVVLGGGGIRGVAHAGAWQALREAEVPVAGIVGTSIGALVGAAIASGMEWRRLVRMGLSLKKEDIVRLNRGVVWVNGIREPSVFRGDLLRRYTEAALPGVTWEALTLPLQVNAVDLGTGRTEWFGVGARTDVSLHEACYASAALPVLFPPARLGDRWFVDGGAGDALPLERARELGAATIVAIDVGSGPEADATKTVEDGIVAIHDRVFAIMSGRRRLEQAARWQGPPELVYVRPDVDGHSAFAFDQVKYFLEEGYRATRQALAARR